MVMAHLESETGIARPVSYLSLISGTSTGGILGAGSRFARRKRVSLLLVAQAHGGAL